MSEAANLATLDEEPYYLPVGDEVETVKSEGGPGAIPKEPFQSLAVSGFDTDAGIEAEPATVLPAEHVLGVVGLKQALAPKVP